MDKIDDLPDSVINLQPFLNAFSIEPKKVKYASIKRITDLLFSTILLLLLFPIFLLIALIVRFSSPGPVFYKSYRIGICGKPILFIKYRTMFVDADKIVDLLREKVKHQEPTFKMKSDPRITKIGKWLRRSSLDELPQILSVFEGAMSLVGPRPPIPTEVYHYDEKAVQRLTIKPGITCYWQVMGRSNLSFEQWIALDLKYIKEMSVWTDFKILLMTFKAVISGEGAY